MRLSLRNTLRSQADDLNNFLVLLQSTGMEHHLPLISLQLAPQCNSLSPCRLVLRFMRPSIPQSRHLAAKACQPSYLHHLLSRNAMDYLIRQLSQRKLYAFVEPCTDVYCNCKFVICRACSNYALSAFCTIDISTGILAFCK